MAWHYVTMSQRPSVMKATASENWMTMARRWLGRFLGLVLQGIWVPSLRWMTITMLVSLEVRL